MSPQVFNALLLLIPALLLSTTGELMLKQGMNQVGGFDFDLGTILNILPRVVTNPFIWLGFAGFMGGSVFWLAVLSRVNLSLAYPVLALGYFVVAVEAWLFLGEHLSWLRLAGILVIFIGVVIVGLSEGQAR